MAKRKSNPGIPPSKRLKTPAAIDAQPGGWKREYGDKLARKFDVTIGEELVTTYDTFGWGPWDNQEPGPASRPDVATASVVAADLVKHYGEKFPADYAEPGERQGFGDGEDLTVWFASQLAAIVVADADLKTATATVINDIDLHQVEFGWGD